jgi:hypothetical protein
MSSVTLELPDETRRRLEEKAARQGQPLEAYIRGVLDAQAGSANGAPPTGPAGPDQKAVEEFDRWLAELEALPPVPLPPGVLNWSREDIYFDHD